MATESRLTIVSGGQTGVDRGALDAALDAGADCGGWCPQDRLAEDGAIDSRYPLRELAGGDYRARTRKNVVDSDATVIIYFTATSGGTEKTRQFCIAEDRPCLLLDAAQITPAQAAAQIADFVAGRGWWRINFAGPRASGEPRAYDFTYDTLRQFLAARG